MNFKIAVSILVLTLQLSDFKAQEQPNSALFKAIMAQDSLLFQVGFNTCDITQFETILHPKFEFYHDKSGRSQRKKFLKDLKNGLCNSPETYQSRRELDLESVEIFPLYDKGILYGAVQNGIHSFYETMAGGEERFASTAKFTHIWILENGMWKLKSGISFDHQTEVH